MFKELTLAYSTVDAPATPISTTALVDTYASTLFRVAYSILRSRDEAEDVVQESFLRVLQHHHKLPDIRDLRPWLIRITWNLALDHHRRIRPAQLDPDFALALAAHTQPADVALADTQHLTAVLAEIDRLPRDERQALLLSAIEELSVTEIAAVLGKSTSAVRALTFRARTRLRERLTQRGIR